MAVKNIFTIEGRKKLEEELKKKREESKILIDEIYESKSKGDISENSEFECAKEAYEMVQSKIAEIENRLSDCIVIDQKNIDTGYVSLLTNVKVKDIKNKKEMKFKIMPDNEINLKEGKISYKSPIGSALMGKKRGDTVEVSVPSGILNLKIVSITAE